jgi:hypothetical protein
MEELDCPDLLEPLVKMELVERPVALDQSEPLENKDHKDRQVTMVHLGPQVMLVHEALGVITDPLEQLDLKDNREISELLDFVVPLVAKDQKVYPVLQDHQVCQENQENKDNLVSQDFVVPVGFMDQRERLVIKEEPGIPVIGVYPEHLVLPEIPEVWEVPD